MGFSVGIGLTSNCNLQCAHCYRDTEHVSQISLDQIKVLCDTIPIDGMGLGTGENGLHPEFTEIVQYLSDQGIKLSIASNGYTITSMPETILSLFHDVEVSIDFPDEAQQDAFRGHGNWTLVHDAIRRAQDAGVEVSILTTLMRTNFAKMDRMVSLARANGVNLRVNAYQPVKTDEFRLTYHEFWEGYRLLFQDGLVVACSEPVVRAAMGLTDVRSPCGHRSIRINPAGQVIPCVYWPLSMMEGKIPTIDDLSNVGVTILENSAFNAARAEPPIGSQCPCHGGCAGRRALNGELDAHDEFCPWVRGLTKELQWKPAPAKDLTRIGNVCTTIVV
ncbi:MAG TPA: radical SAM protein [Candidatus Lokiarchaeia archaeon]|nr:radical SAM protein [Candidatus Lokiarchaeia archaeon]